MCRRTYTHAKMMKLQQSATCPVCLEGAHTDNDDYQENWNQWHAHLLELEAQTEPWLSWQKKEPIVTHKVDGCDMLHWLCRACVYKHNPVSGKFAIETCPVCRFELSIPGRDAENLVNLTEYAHIDVSDEESNEMSFSDDDSESETDVDVFISGYQVSTLGHMSLDCVLTKEVSTQNAARAAGQDITNASVLMVFTRNALYTPCGDERRNWGVQFLSHAISKLEDLNCMYREELGAGHIRPGIFMQFSLFEHAAAAGRHILALPPYFADGRFVTPLYDFSPDGRHAVQMQGFRNELRNNFDDESSDAHNEEVYASASVFFLQAIFPEFIAADQEAIAIYNDGQLLELNAQYNLVPPAFTKREYVVQVLYVIDNIVQRYNQSVYPDRVANTVLPTILGFVQTIIAPRPWVIMQIIQIRDQFKIPPAHLRARRQLWNFGIRIAYADLTLSRQPSISQHQFFERVTAFWQYLDSRDILIFNRIPLLSSVPITSAALIEAAGIEVDPPWIGRTPGPLASVVGPRNELIFEGMKYIDDTSHFFI